MTAASAAKRLIAVDIGNSSTKVGWFDAAKGAETLPQPVLTVDYPTGQTPPEEVARQFPSEPCCWLVASVQREGQRVLTKWVETHRHDDELQVLAYRDLPIEVRSMSRTRSASIGWRQLSRRMQFATPAARAS